MIINTDIPYWRRLLRIVLRSPPVKPLVNLPMMLIGILFNWSPKLDWLIHFWGKWQSFTVAEVQAKINAGADVNATDKAGRTLLNDAVSGGNAEVISILVKAGADVNAKGDLGLTPLHDAVNNGNIEVIPVLIQVGADVNAKNDFGSTPLHAAALWRRVEAIPILIKAEADVNAKDNNGATPLHIAPFGGKAEVISVLLKAGADVNAEGNNGATPLHMAALHGNTEVISALIKAGADVNSTTWFGETPLDWAKAKKKWNAARVLEDAMHQQNRQREKPPERHDEMPSDSAVARKFLELPAVGKLDSGHLKFAYRRMRQRCHPDKGGTAEDFMRAKWAYDILKKEI